MTKRGEDAAPPEGARKRHLSGEEWKANELLKRQVANLQHKLDEATNAHRGQGSGQKAEDEASLRSNNSPWALRLTGILQSI